MTKFLLPFLMVFLSISQVLRLSYVKKRYKKQMDTSISIFRVNKRTR